MEHLDDYKQALTQHVEENLQVRRMLSYLPFATWHIQRHYRLSWQRPVASKWKSSTKPLASNW
jgi:hypothetical protein